MNAYFELFGSTQWVDNEQVEKYLLSLETADVKYIKTSRTGAKLYEITPHHYAATVRDWLDKVLWADIQYYPEDHRVILKSDRTHEDEEVFLNILESINYDEGYGMQELYGYVVFKDNTWLERYEYDGSERWVLCKCPQEPDWNNELLYGDSEEDSKDDEDLPIKYPHYDDELKALESLKKYL